MKRTKHAIHNTHILKTNSQRLIAILFLLLMFGSVNAVSEIINYHMDEGTGTLLYDSSPNDNTALLVGTYTWITDTAFGTYALSFSNGYAQAADTIIIGNKTSISSFNIMRNNGVYKVWELWNNYQHINLVYDSVNQLLYLNYTNTTYGNNVVLLGSFPRSTIFNPQPYHMITINIDFSNSSCEYYMNDTLIATKYIDILPPQDEFSVGVASYDYFGDYDEFKIFNDTLNSSQITTLYINNSIPVTTPTPLTISVKPIDLINYTLPYANQSVSNVVTFEAKLNLMADCDLYIDKLLETSFTNIWEFSYTKELTGNTFHSYLIYCHTLLPNGTLLYEVTPDIPFWTTNNTKKINFYLLDREDNLVTNENLYMVTPCIEAKAFKMFGKAYSWYNKNPVYIEKLNNGAASFNITVPGKYEFCLFRGQLSYNDNYNNYTTDYDIVSWKNQIELGNIYLDNDTINYAFRVSDSDLYKITEPEFWGKTWQDLFTFVVALLIGIPTLAVGLYTGNGKIVLAGVLIIMGGLGISLSNFIWGVVS